MTARAAGFLAFLLLVGGAAALETADLPTETVQQIGAIVEAEMERHQIPGLSLALVVDNEIRYASGFGWADLENRVRASREALFRTASVIKPLTATAVMQLAERGRLDLDAPIQKYCSAFPEKQWPVTARQLLAHLGGVRHYKDAAEARGTAHYLDLAEAVKVFANDPLLHEPGTKFSYTSFGYVLLGCALEGASRMRYEDYMQEYIFRPAGMDHTVPDDTFTLVPNRARGYMRMTEENARFWPERYKRFMKVGEIYNAELHDTSIKLPAGGYLSTAEDLARFLLAVLAGKLIQEETRQQMWTPQKTRDAAEITWGLGWIVPNEMGGERAVRVSGNQPGTSAALVILPEKQFAVVVLANLEGIDLYPLVARLGRLWGHFPQEVED